MLNSVVKTSEFDERKTIFWFGSTLKDKFYSMPDIGEQVACLMDENSEDGVILGAIYSAEDLPTQQTEKELSINLENGSFLKINKEY